MRKTLTIGLCFLLVCSMILPVSMGLDVKTTIERELQSISNDEPSEHIWPMYCYDAQHTGRSPYSTADNPGTIKWKFYIDQGLESSVVIDNNGNLYVGSNGNYLYSISPNGVENWRYDCQHWITTSPAISDDGIVYACSWDDYLYAINSDGSLKWRIDAGGTIKSSPVIGENDIIYFGILGPGTNNGRIYAINPDGTEKWHYDTNDYIFTHPAIGIDSNIYVSSSDNNLYSFYPNGTLYWKFNMNDWPGSPSIADDGTIYVPSQDDYFYSLYPNGTLKWKIKIGSGSLHTPSIASDGTVYIGEDNLYAINPDGTIKWTYNPGDGFHISSRSNAISSDGIIFFGITKGTERGDLVALNQDGTERWIVENIANDWVYSSPSIGSDGTVYVGSKSGPAPYGYIYAINDYDPDAPIAPYIEGPNSGGGGKVIELNFTSTSPVGRDLYYWIDWGDGEIEEWIGPFDLGITITKIHVWPDDKSRTYTVKARAKDTENLWSDWSEFIINIKSKSRVTYSSVWHGFLDMFPILERILDMLRV